MAASTATALRDGGRRAMYNQNAFKLGLFSANVSSGRFNTMAPERWSGTWDDCLRLARIADDGGIDFMLPLGRWKGYGGAVDYQGATFETLTWATALLASTKRITVFGTVHVPLFHPLVAAKQMVTADHVGRGRFGLNIVCGGNPDEDAMFGTPPDHDGRYREGQEWLDVIRTAWTQDDFDFDGEFFHLHGVREKPKPYGDELPIVMNAGTSQVGRAFALRNCDAWFTQVQRPNSRLDAGLDIAVPVIEAAKAEARANGREIGVFSAGNVICRPTHAEAVEYHRYISVECADWASIDEIIKMKGFASWHSPEELAQLRRQLTMGMGGELLVGTPDEIADRLALMHRVGFDGIAVAFVNYADELPYFIDEVGGRLERMGLRSPRSAAS